MLRVHLTKSALPAVGWIPVLQKDFQESEAFPSSSERLGWTRHPERQTQALSPWAGEFSSLFIERRLCLHCAYFTFSRRSRATCQRPCSATELCSLFRNVTLRLICPLPLRLAFSPRCIQCTNQHRFGQLLISSPGGDIDTLTLFVWPAHHRLDECLFLR